MRSRGDARLRIGRMVHRPTIPSSLSSFCLVHQLKVQVSLQDRAGSEDAGGHCARDPRSDNILTRHEQPRDRCGRGKSRFGRAVALRRLVESVNFSAAVAEVVLVRQRRSELVVLDVAAAEMRVRSEAKVRVYVDTCERAMFLKTEK